MIHNQISLSDEDDCGDEKPQELAVSDEAVAMQVVPYCFFLKYARIYDRNWQNFLIQLKNKLHFSNERKIKGFKVWPDELATLVVSYMDVKSLVNTSVINKQWNMICCQNLIWESLCLNNFGVSTSGCNYVGQPRDLYISAHKTYRSIVGGRRSIVRFNHIPSLLWHFVLFSTPLYFILNWQRENIHILIVVNVFVLVVISHTCDIVYICMCEVLRWIKFLMSLQLL